MLRDALPRTSTTMSATARAIITLATTMAGIVERQATAVPATPHPRAPPASARTVGAPVANAGRRRAPAATRMATAISALLATG